MEPFDYPLASHQRRHGPRGYSQPESYQPWLRDEFSFRCVYCLIREQWGRVTGEFDVEHFRPQAINPELATVYDNLLYACGRCNGAKRGSYPIHARPLPPTKFAYFWTVRLRADLPRLFP